MTILFQDEGKSVTDWKLKERPLDRLRDACGWASLAMPLSYQRTEDIANEGLVLED